MKKIICFCILALTISGCGLDEQSKYNVTTLRGNKTIVHENVVIFSSIDNCNAIVVKQNDVKKLIEFKMYDKIIIEKR